MLKIGGELENIDYDQLDSIIQDVSLALAVEIQRSLDLHAASTTDEEVQKIYLSGGSARMPGIKDLIADRERAEVLQAYHHAQRSQPSDVLAFFRSRLKKRVSSELVETSRRPVPVPDDPYGSD